MNRTSLVDRLRGVTVDDVSSFDRTEFLAAGLSPARVNELGLVHCAYFGPTKTSAAAAAQRDTRLAAAGVCVDLLAQIERSIGHVADDTERASYRLTLVRAAARTVTTCAGIAAYAKKIVPPKVVDRAKSAAFGASINGVRTGVFTACEHVMADLEAYLRSRIDPDQPAAPQMAEAFEELIRSEAGVPQASPRPVLVVPAPDHAEILTGEGDEVTLGLSDGTTITGAQYLEEFFSDPDYGLEAAIFHPSHGPVNLYRVQRFANSKQRTLAKLTQPICAFPGCRMPADHCQVHHAKPWKDGGETNMDNLTILCSYHNGVNDDDAHIRKRGRVEIDHGRPTYISPSGYQATNTRHPYGAMDSLFGPVPDTVAA